MNARDRSIVAATLVVAFAGLLPSGVAPARASGLQDRIRRHQRQIHETHVQLQRKRDQLGADRLRERDLRDQLQRTNGAIAGVNARLSELAVRTGDNERRIAAEKVQLDAAQRSLNLHDNLYKKRLVQIYEHGDQGYLGVLFRSRSFSEFVEHWHDMQLLLAANRHAIAERKVAVANVARAERQLTEHLVALQGEQDAQAQARDQLGGLAQERAGLLALAQQQR
ncbi:MAG: PcsB-like coiled-coil domain-containing protein, partial [Rhodanobacteraceae bacterium]